MPGQASDQIEPGTQEKQIGAQRTKEWKALMSRKHQPSSGFRAGEQGTYFYLKATILEVVENQVRENDPPETRQTLKRLLAAGYTRQRAVELIESAVVEEIWQVLQERKPFDRARYKTLLDKLG